MAYIPVADPRRGAPGAAPLRTKIFLISYSFFWKIWQICMLGPPAGGLARNPVSTPAYIIITTRKQSLRRLCFYTCLSFCPQGGGCAWWGGGICMALGVMCGGGHAWQEGVQGRGCVWQGACMTGGMHGRGYAWQGVCIAGGMHGGGCAWQGACMDGGKGGACMIGGMHGTDAPPLNQILRDTVIWSMSRRYASYWNAFLFIGLFMNAGVLCRKPSPFISPSLPYMVLL